MANPTNIPRTALRKNPAAKPAPAQKYSVDFAKWIAFVITLLGIQAWIAGEAYYSGFWGLLGLNESFSPVSLQRTAFIGFLGVFTHWEAAAIVIILTGVYVIFLGITRKKESLQERSRLAIKFDNWFGKFTVEKSIVLFGGAIVLSGSFILCLSLLLSPWIRAAYSAGADNITMQICDLRKGKSVITEAKLLDGTVVSGLLLDRSDKFTAIMDTMSVHVLTVGDKQQLLYSIQLPEVRCQA